MASKMNPIPDGYEGATPYLRVNDAAAAIEFYKKAFGATESYRLTEPGGRIGHAEIRRGVAEAVCRILRAITLTRTPT